MLQNKKIVKKSDVKKIEKIQKDKMCNLRGANKFCGNAEGDEAPEEEVGAEDGVGDGIGALLGSGSLTAGIP
jgi:hypothetical protein